jgi:zinc protease
MIQTFRDAPRPFQQTEVHTLPNGMTLVLKPDTLVPVVALQAWARCGAVDETPNIFGISHGLEHMVFKGTPARSAGEITRAIESNGGAINAATQLETTHYYIDIPSYGADAALDVLADTILRPTFPQVELERERLVILEEIHRRDDSPDATLWDEFASTVFHGTPYGVKVIGNEKTVSAMSREDLMSYFNAHYVPENLAMVVAGDFNKGRMLKKLTSLFGQLPARKAPVKPAVEIGHAKPKKNTLRKPVQQTYFAIGFPTVGFGHPDSIALDVVSDVVGGGISSRLYQRLREETQTVLSISCDYIPFRQKGLFAFFAEVLPENAPRLLEDLILELENIRRSPFVPAELARAKARIKSDWLHGSETPHGQASTLGSLCALDHINLINTYLPKIAALTVNDLTDVFNRYIHPETFFVTKVEPRA